MKINQIAKELNPKELDLNASELGIGGIVAPEIEAVRKSLSLLSEIPGSLTVAMSGSGPSCFALFPDIKKAKNALEDNQKELELLGLKGWCCSFKSKGVSLSN